ncbi:hypothetical protein MNL76_05695 [Fervidobacterium riparium]|uniref:Uncharacterized protein n=1 Tax=Fervidobacterium gondwanense DSM 13020 TaxID=1121883 RepID=A0A1M7SMA5_FERGO|nr:hypothetical protein [Fervidobacterium gondwanense]UXF01472.1 hypothetical protein IB67_07985 [Fervidobacterium riparium]SHN59580.1 hypothetical protein SAMN02745226_01081 [Fervidobacterium gondwanense DSM 13020]
MDFGTFNSQNGNGFSNLSESVERFIRTLIANNELSLARNILSALGKNYNHLLFELEVKAGNYSKAVEIFNYLSEQHQRSYLHIVDAIEKDSSRISEALEKILKEVQAENYPIAIAELQKVKKEFPQVTEIVATELLAAMRRGDSKKIQLLKDILRQLDKGHPVLLQIKKGKSFSNLLLPLAVILLFVIVFANFIISFIDFTHPGGLELSGVMKRLDSLSKQLEEYNGRIDEQYKKLSETVESIRASLEYLDKKLDIQLQTSTSGNVDPSNLVNALYDQLGYIKSKLVTVESEISNLSRSITSVKANTTIEKEPEQTVVYNTYNSIDTSMIQKLVNQVQLLNGKVEQVEAKMNKIQDFLVSKVQTQADSQSVSQTNVEDVNDEIILKLDAEFKTLKERISNLEVAMIELSRKVTENNVAALEKKIDAIFQQLSDITSVILRGNSASERGDTLQSYDIVSRLSNIELEIVSITSEMKEIKNAMSLLRSSVEENQKNLSASRNSDSQLLSLDQKVSELLKLTNSMKDSIDELSNQDNTYKSDKTTQTDLTVLKKKIDDISKQLTELSSSIARISASAENGKDSEISNITDKLNSIESGILTRVEDISKQLAQLSTKISEISTVKSDEVNPEVSGMIDRLNNIESQINAITSEIKEVKDSVGTLSKDVREKTATSLSDSSELQALSQKVFELSKQVNEIKNSLNSLSGQNETYRSNLSSMDTKLSSLSESITDLRNQLSKMSSEFDSLKASLSTLSSKVDSLSQKVIDSNSSNTVKKENDSSQTNKTTSNGSVSADTNNSNGSQQNVQEIIRQTKDLRELFLIGLRFYTNGNYSNASVIFDYLEVQLKDIDVYFKEDVYYYNILCYINQGKVDLARQKYETYKKVYPTGQYRSELASYFK